jgi:hypothetical protein
MPSIMPRTVYPALSAPQEGNDREYQEYEKQYFRDASRASGNSAEAENRGHDGDNEKDHCVVLLCHAEDQSYQRLARRVRVCRFDQCLSLLVSKVHLSQHLFLARAPVR